MEDMQEIERRSAGKGIWTGSCIALLMVAMGCATAPPPPELVQARTTYDLTAGNPTVVQNAPVDLFEARKSLDRAESAYSEEADPEEVSHLAGLAIKRSQIAEAEARSRAANQEADRLKQQRDRSRYDARTREAEIASREAERARALVESLISARRGEPTATFADEIARLEARLVSRDRELAGAGAEQQLRALETARLVDQRLSEQRLSDQRVAEQRRAEELRGDLDLRQRELAARELAAEQRVRALQSETLAAERRATEIAAANEVAARRALEVDTANQRAEQKARELIAANEEAAKRTRELQAANEAAERRAAELVALRDGLARDRAEAQRSRLQPLTADRDLVAAQQDAQAQLDELRRARASSEQRVREFQAAREASEARVRALRADRVATERRVRELKLATNEILQRPPAPAASQPPAPSNLEGSDTSTLAPVASPPSLWRRMVDGVRSIGPGE